MDSSNGTPGDDRSPFPVFVFGFVVGYLLATFLTFYAMGAL